MTDQGSQILNQQGLNQWAFTALSLDTSIAAAFSLASALSFATFFFFLHAALNCGFVATLTTSASQRFLMNGEPCTQLFGCCTFAYCLLLWSHLLIFDTWPRAWHFFRLLPVEKDGFSVFHLNDTWINIFRLISPCLLACKKPFNFSLPQIRAKIKQKNLTLVTSAALAVKYNKVQTKWN